MESLNTRYRALKKCLDSLHESLELFHSKQYAKLHKQLRDSVIQRFEFTIDAFWKFLREYLEKKHGITFTLVSPREVLKTALAVQIIKQQDFAIYEQMLQDRNLTSHTYNELLAEEISSRIQNYYHLLESTANNLEM